VQNKENNRLRRKKRIRKKIAGTTERPRLTVFRSIAHMYAQVVDDTQGKTLVSVSTLSKDVQEKIAGKNKTDASLVIGEALAQACVQQGIDKVVFDRNGFLYHGRVKAVAEAARKAGLQF